MAGGIIILFFSPPIVKKLDLAAYTVLATTSLVTKYL
jgi:hypothetical protein